MYLLNTNTIINYLEASLPAAAMLFMHNIVDEFCDVSVISKMEVPGYNFTSQAEQKTIETFVAGATVLALTDNIVSETIAIRKTQKIKLPDAIIAATAIVYGFTLISRNVADFKTYPPSESSTRTQYKIIFIALLKKLNY